MRLPSLGAPKDPPMRLPSLGAPKDPPMRLPSLGAPTRTLSLCHARINPETPK